MAAAQIPLTFGNAILGIVAETRRLFPAATMDERRAAQGTGLMNLLAGGLGAPPMCFGPGGMAAQVACGARTGRAPLFLGSVLLLAGLFASAQFTSLLGLSPPVRSAPCSLWPAFHSPLVELAAPGTRKRAPCCSPPPPCQCGTPGFGLW